MTRFAMLRLLMLILFAPLSAAAVKSRAVYGFLITPRGSDMPSIPFGHAGVEIDKTGTTTIFRSDETRAPFGNAAVAGVPGRSQYKLYPVDGLDFQAVASCESRPGRVALWRSTATPDQITLRLASGAEVGLGAGAAPRTGASSGTPLSVSCVEIIPLQRAPFKPGEAGLWMDVASGALKARRPDGTDTLPSCSNHLGSQHINLNTCGYPACTFATTFPGCAAPDTDGDGLGDAWEKQQGIDLDCDGVLTSAELVLPGANPLVKDVYVDYFWMEAGDNDTRSHKPFETCTVGVNCTTVNPGFSLYNACTYQPGFPGNLPNGTVLTGTMDRLMSRFAANGIVLHANKGRQIAHDTVMTFGPVPANAVCTIDSPPVFPGANAVNFFDLRAQLEPSTHALSSHFVVFGHFANCSSEFSCSLSNPTCPGPYIFLSSGQSEVFGSNFMVTLGGYAYNCIDGWVINEASVFMHELGHNFDLSHGGFNDTDNYKPNYFSVMNYNWINTGLIRFFTESPLIDYSHGRFSSLDENDLDESVGIQPFADFLTVRRCGSDISLVTIDAIDWNCDTIIQSKAGYPPCVVDADCCPDYDPTCVLGVPAGVSCVGGVCKEAWDITGGNDGALHVLVDHNDWADLHYAFQCASPAPIP